MVEDTLVVGGGFFAFRLFLLRLTKRYRDCAVMLMVGMIVIPSPLIVIIMFQFRYIVTTSVSVTGQAIWTAISRNWTTTLL